MTVLTVAELGAHKGLPADFLRSPGVGLHDLPGGVGIPYYTDEPANWQGHRWVGPVKLRTALAAVDGSYWVEGLALYAYGGWRIGREERPLSDPPVGLVVCEGESDCWALWLHGFRAIGLPGANCVDTLLLEHVDEFARVYVVHEPDQAGDRFVAGVTERLGELAYRGQARELRMPPGVKDPCHLHQCCGERFAEVLGQCMESAGRLAPPSAVMSEAELRRLFLTLQRRPKVAALLWNLLRRSAVNA
jgi:putative DNA primase/helicase